LHGSLHDKLTGLADRTFLADRFEQALRLGRRQDSITGLLLIDLDRFKDVNDTLGHHCGDSLLDQIGKRLISEAREIDSVARLGGDEFAILLPSVEGLEGCQVCTVTILRRSCSAPTSPCTQPRSRARTYSPTTRERIGELRNAWPCSANCGEVWIAANCSGVPTQGQPEHRRSHRGGGVGALAGSGARPRASE